MKKRILISFAFVVLLLEVGFGVYLAFERKYESALNSINLPIGLVEDIQIDTNRELEIATLLPEEGPVADARAVVPAKKFSPRSANTNIPVKKVVAVYSASSRSPKSVVSKPVVKIEQNKHVVAVKTVENREAPVTDVGAKGEQPRAENKSLIAKAQTVLKKPFGWIKAIGSKLR